MGEHYFPTNAVVELCIIYKYEPIMYVCVYSINSVKGIRAQISKLRWLRNYIHRHISLWEVSQLSYKQCEAIKFKQDSAWHKDWELKTPNCLNWSFWCGFETFHMTTRPFVNRTAIVPAIFNFVRVILPCIIHAFAIWFAVQKLFMGYFHVLQSSISV